MFQSLFSNLNSSMCHVYALQQFQGNDKMDKRKNSVKKKKKRTSQFTIYSAYFSVETKDSI